MRSLLVLVVLLSTLATIGQDKPQAELVDEFGPIQCDELLARIDNLAIRVRNDPATKGVAVISGSNTHLIEKLQLEIRLTSGIRRHGADIRSIVTVVRGKEEGKTLVQFWVVPSGAEEPARSASKWNLSIPTQNKLIDFHADNDAICYYLTVHEYLRELLDANPKLRIKAVVGETSLKRFRNKAAILRQAFGSYDSRRLRIVRKREFAYYDTLTNYYLMP
ncbi:MAG TPA: hypothetical protein PKA82_10955 [Pyrinomonadaceae bacterium]|nr:hypothetical protein [Pyrinomonadaceae bacterium]